MAVNDLPDALQKPDWAVNPAWSEQPWDIAAGQSLVKDENLFLDKGVGDITGIGDLLDQWNVGDVVATLNSIGAVVEHAGRRGERRHASPRSVLDEMFVDVAQAAKG